MIINSLDLISSSTQELLQIPVEVVPKIIIAIAILLVGWIIGWLIERVMETVFRAVPFFDEALRSAGLEEITRRAGMRVNLGRFFGVILKVFIIVIFLVASLEVLGLQSVNQFLIERVLEYIPQVVSAALVVVIGLIVANIVSRLVGSASRAAKVEGGLAVKVTKWSVVILSVMVAMAELGIASEIIQSMIVGVIAAASLALGLAFGLGGQQAASDFLDRVKNDIEKG